MDYTIPVKIQPLYQSKIWGGTRIAQDMHRSLPRTDIGEAWDISAIPDAQSTVLCDPPLPLAQYCADAAFYGETPLASFPLLIKILGATEPLSVQVHPSDSNCLVGEAGKAEAWYILHAEPGAQIVYGLNCTKEDFAAAVQQGRTDDCLLRHTARSGQVYNILPGQIHALGAGITLYEVQQTSDTTYRVYDYDRRDAQGQLRPLHQARALAVTDATLPHEITAGVTQTQGALVRTRYLHTPHFTLERLQVQGLAQDEYFHSFAAYTVIAGQGRIATLQVCMGDVVLAPAAAGCMTLQGDMTLLKSHLPNTAAYQQLLLAQGLQVCAGGEVVRNG